MALVLIVDDDPQLISVLRRVLERHGYRVLDARDGDEALWLFRSEQPQVVITDLEMPIRDGFHLIREIRAGGSAVPILVATGGATDDVRAAALQHGANAVFAKPVPFAVVRAFLQDVVPTPAPPTRDGPR